MLGDRGPAALKQRRAPVPGCSVLNLRPRVCLLQPEPLVCTTSPRCCCVGSASVDAASVGPSRRVSTDDAPRVSSSAAPLMQQAADRRHGKQKKHAQQAAGPSTNTAPAPAPAPSSTGTSRRSSQQQEQPSSNPGPGQQEDFPSHASSSADSEPSSPEVDPYPHPYVMKIAMHTEAGSAAGHLVRRLRSRPPEESTIKVTFAGGRGLFKALRTLAIAHDYLGQHGCGLSFVPIGYEMCSHQPRPEDELPVRAYPGAYVPEGFKEVYTVLAWSRQRAAREIEYHPSKQKGPPVYDFALDARRSWKNKAEVGRDTSYSLADMLYGQLVLQHEMQEQQYLQQQQQQQQQQLQQQQKQGFGGDAQSPQPSGLGQQEQAPTGHAAPPFYAPSGPRRRMYAEGSGGGTKEAAGAEDGEGAESGRPMSWSGPIILSCDAAQSCTILAALLMFQQRLERESSLRQVVCTVYNNRRAPGIRLDGRSGFVFKVLTRPLVCATSPRTVKKHWRELQPWGPTGRSQGSGGGNGSGGKAAGADGREQGIEPAPAAE